MSEYDPNLCTKCGVCCYLSLLGEDGVRYYTPFTCRKLDCETKLCKCYDKRFKKAFWCLNIEEAIKQGQLPEGCPYVTDNKEYRGPKPDYRESPMVTVKVNELLSSQNGVFFTINGVKITLDSLWIPEKTTYRDPVTVEVSANESPEPRSCD